MQKSYSSDEKNKQVEIPSHQYFRDASAMIAIKTNNMTVIQLKGLSGLLYNAREKLFIEEEHKISIKDLIGYSGYSRNDLDYLKDAMAELQDIVVSYNVLGKDPNEYKAYSKGKKTKSKDYDKRTHLLAGVDFVKNPGYMTYQFSFIIKDMLKDGTFAVLSLAIARNLKTKPALCLYRIGNDYKKVFNTKPILLDDLKELLGSEKTDYPTFKEFNRWILKPACLHIKNDTDLEMTPEFVRIKRKVTAVKFKIRQKKSPFILQQPDVSLIESKINPKNKNPYDKLTDDELEYEYERINQTITWTEALTKQRNSIREERKRRGL